MKLNNYKKIKKISSVVVMLMYAGLAAGNDEVFVAAEKCSQSNSTAWKSGELKPGMSSHFGVIGNNRYPDMWEYWYITEGTNETNFVPEPMKQRDTPLSDKYFQMSSPKGTAYIERSIYGILAPGKECIGLGFSFKNPSAAKLPVEISGGLRLYNFDPQNPFFVYLFTRDTSGRTVKICSSHQENFFFTRGSNDKLAYYFRLDSDAELAPGARLYVVVVDLKPVSTKQRKVFCFDEGLGRLQYIPRIIIKSRIK